MTDEQQEARQRQALEDARAEHDRRRSLVRGKTRDEAVRLLHADMDAAGVSRSVFGQAAREATIRAYLGELS